VLTCVCLRPAALTLSVFAPAKPLLWIGFQHSTLVSSWRRYFQFSFVMDEKLDQEGRYIFAGARLGRWASHEGTGGAWGLLQEGGWQCQGDSSSGRLAACWNTGVALRRRQAAALS
jgi:hypothetical protein